jgi:hypothetical protein
MFGWGRLRGEWWIRYMQMNDDDADLWWLGFILFFNVLFGLQFFVHIFTTAQMKILPAFSFESQSVNMDSKPNIRGLFSRHCGFLREIYKRKLLWRGYDDPSVCLPAYFKSCSMQWNSFKCCFGLILFWFSFVRSKPYFYRSLNRAPFMYPNSAPGSL